MNKVFTKIISAVAGIAMIIGVGFAIGNHKESNGVEAAYNDGTAAESPWLGTFSNNIILWNFQNVLQIKQEQHSGQSAPNASYTAAPRWYSGNKITITPARYMAINGLQITATTVSYANTLQSSTFTNATAIAADKIVTIVPTNPSQAVTIVMGGQCRIENGSTVTVKYWYTDNTPVFGTLDHIKITTPANRTEFDVGETFSSAGLILTGYDNANESTAVTQVYSSGYTTNFDGHEFLENELGSQTVTVTYSDKTVTYPITVTKAPDFVHTYASNSVYDQTSGNTSDETVCTPESGPEYINLGGYNYSDKGGCMSFMNATGMYLGNNEEYVVNGKQRYISKIIITTYEDDSAKLTMTEGPSALPTTKTITPTLRDDNKTLVYVFSGETAFFKLSKSTNSYVNLTSIKVYLGDVIYAKDIIAREISTSASLAFSNYNRSGQALVDRLNRNTTGIASGSSYGSWSGKTSASEAVYAGQSAGGNNSIQLRSDNNNSGIVTTASGGYVKKITIEWNSNTVNGRTLLVCGKNTPYSAPTDLYANETIGTIIGNIAYGSSTTLTINGNYEYIGLRSSTGAMYINSIAIQWGEVTYTFENLGIRFTGSISEEMWNRLNSESTIEGYGMLLSTAAYLGANPLKNYYESANGTDVKKFDNTDTVHEPAFKATPTLKNGNYVWNLFKTVYFDPHAIYTANLQYVAVAFIKLANDEVVFLKEQSTSIRRLAIALIESGERDANSLGGSISYLANLQKEVMSYGRKKIFNPRSNRCQI